METLEPFNIIYQTAEDGLGDTVKPRLMEADADLERVLVIDDRDTPLTLSLIHIYSQSTLVSSTSALRSMGTGWAVGSSRSVIVSAMKLRLGMSPC